MIDEHYNHLPIAHDFYKVSQKPMHKNILVIDDDPAILEVIKIILEEEAYQVFVYKDGEQICDKIRKHNIDLILLDYWIPPGVDGGQIVVHLKGLEQMCKIPVIIISANHNLEKKIREVGADDFIPKPFDINTLLTKVKQFTSQTYTELS